METLFQQNTQNEGSREEDTSTSHRLHQSGNYEDLGVPIVAEIGHSMTKIGWAGEVHPKSYFSSSVAIIRNKYPQQPGVPTTTGKTRSKFRCIQALDRDISDLSLSKKTFGRSGKYASSDGQWELANPINPASGMIPFDGDGIVRIDDEFKGNGAISDLPSSLSNNSFATNEALELIDHAMSFGCQQLGLSGSHNTHGTLSEEGISVAISQPLLLVEKSYTPQKLRAMMTELAFEQYSVPKFFLGKDAALSCYAVGHTSGIVVDIGGSACTVSPVHEGWIESCGVIRTPVGGDAMAYHVLQRTDSLSQQPREQNDSQSAEGHPYTLPDGTIVTITNRMKYECEEILFGRDTRFSKIREDLCHKAREDAGLAKSSRGASPTCIESASKSLGSHPSPSPFQEPQWLSFSSLPLQNVVCDSAFRCDRDQQVQLLGTVILTGGGACLPGLTDRLRKEVEALIHTHTPGWRVKVLSPNFPERAVGSWLGGSILGALPIMEDFWISKQEYEEFGSNIVKKKCP